MCLAWGQVRRILNECLGCVPFWVAALTEWQSQFCGTHTADCRHCLESWGTGAGHQQVALSPERALALSLHMWSHSRGWTSAGRHVRNVPQWQRSGPAWRETDGPGNLPLGIYIHLMPAGFLVLYFPLLREVVFSANPQKWKIDSVKGWVKYWSLALGPWYEVLMDSAWIWMRFAFNWPWMLQG